MGGMRSVALIALSVLLLTASHAGYARAVRNAAAFNGVPESNLETGSSSELLNYNPVANPAAVVESKDGHARFTVLTERLVRLEWTSKAEFEDRASIAIVNRFVPKVPDFTQSQDSQTTVIRTAFFNLTYTENPGATSGFTEENLVVKGTGKMRPAASFQGTWVPGMKNEGALPGTVKSLDAFGPEPLNCTTIEAHNQTVNHQSLHCSWALFSRSGWALFDDTTTPMLNSEGQGWWDLDKKNRNKNDWYLFAHGSDYLQALKDYRTVGGVIPLLRKSVLGTWWTRWYNYNSDGVKDVVDQFRQYSLPLDVLVYDMNW